MKKSFIAIATILFLIILTITYVKYIWKGDYISHAGSDIKVSITGNSTSFLVYPRGSMTITSFIQTELNENKREIYVWFYEKLYLMGGVLKLDNHIQLPVKGKYNIYYKNQDGSIDFIKSIEYK